MKREGILQHLVFLPIDTFFEPVYKQVEILQASPVWHINNQKVINNTNRRFDTCIRIKRKISIFSFKIKNLRPLVLLTFLLLFYISTFAQQKYRYLVQFKDKANSGYSLTKPEAFLSQKSLQRRAKNEVSLTEQDLPVSPSYLKELTNLGAKVLYPLKWINGALIEMSPNVKAAILANKNVKSFYFPFALDSSASNSGNSTQYTIQSIQKKQTEINYGSSSFQNYQIGLEQMHLAGIAGKEVLITLLDDGFIGSNSLPVFDNLLNEKRLLATLTTSPNRKTVFEKGSHGTNVLSVITGYAENNLIGGAFQANIALAQTEESEWEKLVEEVNWLRGAEWADSLGTDIIQSSLGYSTFDLPFYNHAYADMNGSNTLVTKAANWATERGIICVISAGNEGASQWKYITAPADAMNILSVGAVNITSTKVNFSSLGPSFDGRTKPDVVALGTGVRAATTDGSFGFLNGTSFASPIIASLTAGLIEQFPKASAENIRKAIRNSGNLAKSPDNNLGYGLPNYAKAVELLRPVATDQEEITVYPNPLKLGDPLTIKSAEKIKADVELVNMQGQIILFTNWEGVEKIISLGPIPSGKYFFRIKSASLLKIIPIIVY